MALKKADKGSNRATAQNRAAGRNEASAVNRLPYRQVVRPMLSRLSNAVAALKTQMVRNLPQTISSRLAGLMSNVSMVPRSFSPAHRSTAGYSAPANDHMTRMNGKMRTSMSSRSSEARLPIRSEEHTSELQSHVNLVCRLL